MKLGDCRGIVEAINDSCTCGGNGPGDGCPACEVFHAIKDMEMFSEEEKRAACEKAWDEGSKMSRLSMYQVVHFPINPYARKESRP